MEDLSFSLSECGITGETLRDFEQHGITNLQLLKEVSENDADFKQLVPCMGTRVQIRLKLKNKNSLDTLISPSSSTGTVESVETPLDNNTNKIPFVSSCNASETYSNLSSFSHIDVEEPPQKYIIIEDIPLPQPRQSDATHQMVKPSIEDCLVKQDFDLSKLLEETIVGRAIKSIYNLEKQLDSRYQSYLAEIIIQHFVNVQPFRRLQNSDFEKLSHNIAHLFPNEIPGVYYTAPIRKRNSRSNKSIIARGKLVDKYRNKLSFLRKAKSLPSRLFDEGDSTDDSSLVTDENHNNFEDDLTWLKNNQEPWTEVQYRWTKTYEFRQRLLSKEVEIHEVLNEFPIIKNPLGNTLIEADFKSRYPESYQKIFSRFEWVFNSLLKIRNKHLTPADNLLLEIIQSSELNKESRHFLMLNILVSLLPTKSLNKKTKTNWHPTVNDSKEGIFVQIKIPGDLENVIEKKRDILKKYGLPMLPFVIVESTSYTDIKNIFGSFDKVIYKVNTILKAVDICFQLIHVLNLIYPFESEHIWMFIQMSVCDLKTKYDNIPNILDIVNKINVQAKEL